MNKHPLLFSLTGKRGFWSPVLRSWWNSYSAFFFLFRSLSSKNACICLMRSLSLSSLELSFFLFCELSLTLDDAILIGQPNLLVLTQSIYWHQGHVEWSILLLLRRYYKWWLSSFWERDCVGPPGESWLLRRRAYLRAELVWLATNQTNKQMRNETLRGVLQQVRLGTILRVGKTRKPPKTKGDG